MKLIYAICGALFGLIIVWIVFYIISLSFEDPTAIGGLTPFLMLFIPVGCIAGAKTGIDIFKDKK